MSKEERPQERDGRKGAQRDPEETSPWWVAEDAFRWGWSLGATAPESNESLMARHSLCALARKAVTRSEKS
jgi:hypothetical protein